MSSLAFDKHGKSFKFNRLTRRLGVRVFSNPGGRGGCFAVTDADGEPLYLDADADHLEFRRAVRNEPGLYRLDQCDEDGREIDGAPPAYATVRDSARNGGGVDEVDPRDAIIIQLARANAELAQTNSDIAKTAIQNNAALMDAAANLVRAYSAAPPPPPPPPAPIARKDDDDEDDDDDDEVDEGETPEIAKAAGFMDKLEKVMKVIETVPSILEAVPALIAMFQQMMGKKTPTPTPTPAEPSGTRPEPAPTAGPTAAPSSGPEATGAAAGSGGSPATPATPPPASSEPPRSEAPPSAPSETPTPPVAEPVAPPDTTSPRAPTVDAVSTGAAPAAGVAPSTAPGHAAAEAANTNAPAPTSAPLPVTAPARSPAPGTVRNAPPAPPTPTAAQWAHLLAVREQLCNADRALATTVIKRMPPQVLTQWLGELSALSVEDATKMVRWIIAQSRPQRGAAQG